jgi:hypothetical protein
LKRQNGSLGINTVSPDGKWIAFSDSEGLKIKNMASGTIETIRNNVLPRDPDGVGVQLFAPMKWSLNSKYLLYTISLYEGRHYGFFEANTGVYNDSALTVSPDSIDLIESDGKDYLVYSTSNSNDIYGGIPGLYVAEILSAKNINSVNIVKDKGFDIVGSEYNKDRGYIEFDFYKYISNGKKEGAYRGTISLTGENFSEMYIADGDRP